MSRGGGGRGPPEIDHLHSLKIDNISFRTSAEDLRRLFDRYGEIGDIYIPKDPYTRQSKGFAFVRYYRRDDAEYAMENTDGRRLDGREMRVASARYSRPHEAGGGGYRGRSRSRSPRRRDSRSRSRSRSPRRRRSPSRSRSRSPRRRGSRDKQSGSRSRSKSNSRSRSKSVERRREEGSKSVSRSP